MSYESKGNLVGGAPLIVEELDLSGMGLYTIEQKTALLKSGAFDDFFPAEDYLGSKWVGKGYYWERRSDEGVKWHIFEDKDIKFHKALQDPGGDSNPIRFEDGKWWWYDEVWVGRNGPYDTEAEAEADLDKYVKENL